MKKIFLSFLLLASISGAKEVQVVFSFSTPPYVFKDGSGIVLTIVKEALSYKGHTFIPVFVNTGRSFEMFKHGYVDATSIIQESSGLEAFYSDNFMQYHNAAFALKSSNYDIKNLDDLVQYTFSAFQNARKYLGEEFGIIATKAGDKYSEIADQKQQVYKLLMGRTNVVVMDRHIFKFYKNELIAEKKVDPDIQTQLFELFEPTKYKTAFRDKTLRDDFNEGIKHLKETGKIDAIYNDYGNKYFMVKR